MTAPFWKGVISFGMVAIPVKMSVAIETKTIAFHYLHKKCRTRPKQMLYCAQDKEYFNAAETVKGYEYSKNQYVIFEEGDFEKVPVGPRIVSISLVLLKPVKSTLFTTATAIIWSPKNWAKNRSHC